MKKYSEYLNEQYIPLTRDEVKALGTLNTGFNPKELRTYATAANHEEWNEAIKEALTKTLDEIVFLREQLAVAYQYIGRRAPNPAPTKYREVMHHATRIRGEELEASQ